LKISELLNLTSWHVKYGTRFCVYITRILANTYKPQTPTSLALKYELSMPIYAVAIESR